MFNWLKIKLNQIVEWFGNLFVAVFKSAWDILTDMVSWTFEKLLGIAVSAANAIDVSGLSGYNPAGSLPAEIINVMALCGVGTAAAIIVGAIGIRLVLQLIPFTRLGS